MHVVSNDGLYHVVINYDTCFYIMVKDLSDDLLAVCLGLVTPTLMA